MSQKPDLRFAVSVPEQAGNPIDWSKAPEWAQWATWRRTGYDWVYWYAEKPADDGKWVSGAHYRDVQDINAGVVIEERPLPAQTAPEEPQELCPDCGQNHKRQRQDYPVGAKVLALTQISRAITKGCIGKVVGHCDDGRAIITFDREPNAGHTFHYPESAITMWGDEAVEIPPFPLGVHLEIEVVFPREYRIGYKYENVHYIPGSGSYYPFREAMARCWQEFCERFSQ